MAKALHSLMRKAALAALFLLGLAAPSMAATLYISEFPNALSQVGTTQPQVPPQASITDQTVALSGASARSNAFNALTRAVMLTCDQGCSVLFGGSSVAATTSNNLLQQGVPYLFTVSPGTYVAAIANAAGNTATGGGGTSTVVQPTASQLNAQVVGNVASGANDAGNPVKIGGVYNATIPAVTDGQRVNWAMSANGAGIVQSPFSSVAITDGTTNTLPLPLCSAISSGTASSSCAYRVFPLIFNGTTWDRQKSDAAVTGALAVTPQVSSSAGAGIVSVSSTVVESNHVIKASSGNFYGFEVTTGATAGFVLVSNTTTAPAAGGAAITPVKCYVVAANSTLGISYSPPLQLSTGITVVFSTTGCFTNTASATAFISGDAK